MSDYASPARMTRSVRDKIPKRDRFGQRTSLRIQRASRTSTPGGRLERTNSVALMSLERSSSSVTNMHNLGHERPFVAPGPTPLGSSVLPVPLVNSL
eukprot:2624405-Pyramimonas_sp.AAC.2